MLVTWRKILTHEDVSGDGRIYGGDTYVHILQMPQEWKGY